MSTEKINKLIINSGIVSHYKVLDILRKKEWSVLISPYYYDNIASATKEIDIIAEKQIDFVDKFDKDVQINIQLFLECKYIKNEIVLWFDAVDMDKAVLKLEEITGLTILHKKLDADIKPENFHYLENKNVVKLFSTNTNKEDVMYKAISQCLNSQIYYEQWIYGTIMNPFSNEAISRIIKYPVIVCDNFDNLVEVKFNEKNDFSTCQIENSFLIETNYTHLDKTGKLVESSYFLIDVVDFDYFEKFLDKIEMETRSLLEPHFYKNKKS